MKVHVVLSPEAKRLIRGQSPEHLDTEAQGLLDKLAHAGLSAPNVARAVRHGIVSGELVAEGLDRLKRLPEVATVDVDGPMRALR